MIASNTIIFYTRHEVEATCEVVPVSETFTMEQALEIFPNPIPGNFKII